MNILVISTVRFRSNGISNVIKNLYATNIFRGQKVVLLIPEDADNTMLSCVDKDFIIYQFNRTPRNILKYILYILSIIKKEKIEILHIHGNSHLLSIELLAGLIGQCKIRAVHSHNTTCNHILLHKLLTPIFKMLCTDSFACGQEAGKWMFGNSPFIVINNGINASNYSFNKDKRDYYRNKYNINDSIVLGHVGNLNEQKNQLYLIDILNCLDDRFKLILVGEGPLEAEIKNKIKTHNLDSRIILMGISKDVGGLLSAMDIIVMPSLYEGLPLSLIEEQANGLPCVVSDTITNEVNLTNLVSFLSLQSSPKLWAKKIESTSVIANRASISNESIELIIDKDYDVETISLKLMHYYEARLGGHILNK